MKDWSKFDRENFILYYSVDWEDFLKIDELNADNSTKIYLNKINMLLDSVRYVVKCKLKFKSKPWITLGLQKSISSTIFLQPTDKKEIANIIFSLNSNI